VEQAEDAEVLRFAQDDQSARMTRLPGDQIARMMRFKLGVLEISPVGADADFH
jgi:hypothetical protein